VTGVDMSGVVIDRRFRLERRLGGGGMGAVYAAEHLTTGRRAAVKIVSPALLGSPEAGLRVQREARAAARVQSEFIVQILDVGVDDAVGTWLAMELLSGEDVERRLARERVLHPRDAAEIALQIARALAKAHAAAVVHRDLKPANVFLCESEDRAVHVKVVDFGIAKLLDDLPTSGSALSKAGTIIGTFAYMSPEQAAGRPIDHRTDLWSLGCVLYEMLAGRSPYAHAGQGEQILLAMQRADPPSLALVAPHVPAALARVVDALLVRDREHRASEAVAVVRMLERVRASLPAGEHVAYAATLIAPAAAAGTLPSGTAVAPTELRPRELDLPAPSVEAPPAATSRSFDPAPLPAPTPAFTASAPALGPPSSAVSSAPRASSPSSAPNARTVARARAVESREARAHEHPLDVAAREQAEAEARAGRLRAALLVAAVLVVALLLRGLLG
jgi:serine/threonine protein kinase